MSKIAKDTEQHTQQLLSIEEYNRHIQRLVFIDTTRNNLLTFSFTAVLTLLGIVIATDRVISPLVCLIPYFLLIPFTARISYYRLTSAHINTFLKRFAPEKNIFTRGSSIAHEGQGYMYPLIAWLINHEMGVLAIAIGIIYFYQYCNYTNLYTWWNVLLAFVPIPFIVVVFMISNSTYSYEKLCKSYELKWEKYYEETIK